MGMTNCADCGWKVSERAKACPNCGGILIEEAEENTIVRVWTEEANRLRSIASAVEVLGGLFNLVIAGFGIYLLAKGLAEAGVAYLFAGVSGIGFCIMIGAGFDGMAALIEATQSGIRRK
ncbi:MAG: hypothetical protein L6Q38_03320 [Nitrospira sp.]|nr:hypothetical protein [Nitrospira sp.]